MSELRVVVEADGGSRGNPGPAGYGAVVRDADTGEVLAERAASLGRATNNVAEYNGLLAGLRAAAELGAASLEVRMDSKLVVEQMSGRWRVKHPDLQPLHAEGRRLAAALPSVSFGWIPRERNSYADRLANEAMDAAAAGKEWSSSLDPAGSEESVPAPANADDGWLADDDRPTRLILVRHGSTELSGQRYSGRGDPALNELGRAQARALAARLASLKAEEAAVVSSPLTRALSTATEIAEALGTTVETDDGLQELGRRGDEHSEGRLA